MKGTLVKLFFASFFAALFLLPCFVTAADEFVVGPLDSVKISTVGLDKPVQLVATADSKSYSFPKAMEITLAYGDKNSLTRDYVAETIKATKITFSKDVAVPQSLSAPANPAATIDLKSLKNAESKKIRVATEKLFSQTLSPTRITLPPAYCKAEIVSAEPAAITATNKPSTLTFNFKQFAPINVLSTDGKETHFLANKIVLMNAQNAKFEWTSTATVIASLCKDNSEDNFIHYGVDVKAAEDKSKISTATFQTLSEAEAASEEKLLTKFDVNAKKERLQIKYELSAASDFKIKMEPVVYDAKALKTMGFTESDYLAKYTPDFKTVPMKVGGKDSFITIDEKGTLYSVKKAYFDKKKLSETLEWGYATSQEASQDKKTIASKKIFAGTYSLSASTKGGVIESQKTIDLNAVGLENPEVTQVLLDKKKHEKQVGDYYFKIVDYTNAGKVVLAHHKEKEKYVNEANYVPYPPNTLIKLEDKLFIVITPYSEDSDYVVLTVYRGEKPNAILEPVVTQPPKQPSGSKLRGQECDPGKEWDANINNCALGSGVSGKKCNDLVVWSQNIRGNCVAKDKEGNDIYCVKNFAPKGKTPNPQFICAAMFQIATNQPCYAVAPPGTTPSECKQTGASGSYLCVGPYDNSRKAEGVFQGTCKPPAVEAETGDLGSCDAFLNFVEETVDAKSALTKLSIDVVYAFDAQKAKTVKLFLVPPAEIAQALGKKDDADFFEPSKPGKGTIYAESNNAALINEIKKYEAKHSGAQPVFKVKVKLYSDENYKNLLGEVECKTKLYPKDEEQKALTEKINSFTGGFQLDDISMKLDKTFVVFTATYKDDTGKLKEFLKESRKRVWPFVGLLDKDNKFIDNSFFATDADNRVDYPGTTVSADKTTISVKIRLEDIRNDPTIAGILTTDNPTAAANIGFWVYLDEGVAGRDWKDVGSIEFKEEKGAANVKALKESIGTMVEATDADISGALTDFSLTGLSMTFEGSDVVFTAPYSGNGKLVQKLFKDYGKDRVWPYVALVDSNGGIMTSYDDKGKLDSYTMMVAGASGIKGSYEIPKADYSGTRISVSDSKISVKIRLQDLVSGDNKGVLDALSNDAAANIALYVLTDESSVAGEYRNLVTQGPVKFDDADAKIKVGELKAKLEALNGQQEKQLSDAEEVFGKGKLSVVTDGELITFKATFDSQLSEFLKNACAEDVTGQIALKSGDNDFVYTYNYPLAVDKSSVILKLSVDALFFDLEVDHGLTENKERLDSLTDIEFSLFCQTKTVDDGITLPPETKEQTVKELKDALLKKLGETTPESSSTAAPAETLEKPDWQKTLEAIQGSKDQPNFQFTYVNLVKARDQRLKLTVRYKPVDIHGKLGVNVRLTGTDFTLDSRDPATKWSFETRLVNGEQEVVFDLPPATTSLGKYEGINEKTLEEYARTKGIDATIWVRIEGAPDFYELGKITAKLK